MPEIHSTAIVDKLAKIADNVKIGPYCIIGPNVEIGGGSLLMAHCYINGHTTIGRDNKIFPFASIGTTPQDYGFKENISYVKIGDRNVFREGATVNTGTKEGSETIIGNDCFFMINSHVAHNCKVGNKVILANCALLAGYVQVGDNAILSGNTAVHQFCRVGRFSLLGGGGVISMDLPPFVISVGRNGAVSGINIVGLRRNNFSRETIKAIEDLYKIFFRQNLNVVDAFEKINKELPPLPEIKEFIEFVKESKRGVLRRDHVR
jgi:UDP-N-acetylglucosamine acyltransferase